MDNTPVQHVLIIADNNKEGVNLASIIREGIKSPLHVDTASHHGWEPLLGEDTDMVIILTGGPIPSVEALLDNINKRAPDVPIIVFSKEMGLEDSKKLLLAGALKVFNKGANREEITSTIKDTLLLASKGHISGVGLPVALQMLELERKTCTLTVRSGDKKGLLFFKNGELINAQTTDRQGIDAALEIASWNDVELEFRNFCKYSNRSIDMPLAFILLEASRQKDEATSEETDQREMAGRIEGDQAQGADSDTFPGINELDFDLPEPRLFDLEKEMREGPLAGPLKRIEGALARAIGPIAKTIFKRNVVAWAKDTEPNLENIQHLIDLLCIEIEDDDLIEEFRREVGL